MPEVSSVPSSSVREGRVPSKRKPKYRIQRRVTQNRVFRGYIEEYKSIMTVERIMCPIEKCASSISITNATSTASAIS